jgi:hypothetical protein
MRRFALPVGASAAVVFGAPFIGQLRAAVQSAFPAQYTRIVGGVVVLALTTAVIAALLRIKDRRALRYGCIAAALAVGTGYAVLSATGDPSVDAVERFHFVEYGLITLLYYRAWRGVGVADASLLILPALAGILVGICEEWLQWFIPARVGEVRDVLLNVVAITCGLLFSVALDPPPPLARSLPPSSLKRVKRFGAVVVLALAAFVHAVHLGYIVGDPKIGSFRSVYTREQLGALAQNRLERWRTAPPRTWSRLSREDQYLSEGVMHVRRRNRCWTEQNLRCAWHENLILEEYFQPVLDTPSYISASGFRWPANQRSDAAARPLADDGIYLSEADEVPIVVWSKIGFWCIVAGVIVLLLW